MFNYTPLNWYWAGQNGVFSSASRSIIAEGDSAYAAWLLQGNIATLWPKDEAGLETPEALDEVLAPYGISTGLSFVNLNAELKTAASAACSVIVTQIIPDETHATAFQNAAALVNASGGLAPTVAPLSTKFAAMATAFGAPSADAFASLVMVMQGANLDLSTTIANLNGAAETATTAAQLGVALSAFETGLGVVVAEISAAWPSIQAPDPIVIKGING